MFIRTKEYYMGSDIVLNTDQIVYYGSGDANPKHATLIQTNRPSAIYIDMPLEQFDRIVRCGADA